MFGNYLLKKFNKEKAIEISRDSITRYIEITDNVSLKGIQLNWKEIAAIDGSMKKNSFEKVKEEDVSRIADKFFIEKDVDGKKIIGVKSMEEVMGELKLEKKTKENARNNFKQLKSIGLFSGNLAANSPNRAFIEDIKLEAINIYNSYDILPSVIVAQAALETGWGKSELSEKSNNLFGIKADKSWKGQKVKMKTSENYKDVIYDNFRVYETKSQSIKDYGEFLKNNKRYRDNGVFNANHYTTQAKAIEKAGYSTKSDKEGELLYSKLLINIIRENDLELLDYEVIKNKNNGILNR